MTETRKLSSRQLKICFLIPYFQIYFPKTLNYWLKQTVSYETLAKFTSRVSHERSLNHVFRKNRNSLAKDRYWSHYYREFNPFLANVRILYLMKSPEIQRIFGVSRENEIGTLIWNSLSYSSLDSLNPFHANVPFFIPFLQRE